MHVFFWLCPSGTVDLDFTGQTQDTVSGLYDFLFREYSANQGRWPWPDPAGMRAVDPANPQTWNHYAYVGNMPLNSVDHLGLLSWMSDAGPYIRAMARTSAFFSTFEFFPIITDGHDREQTGFLGFVGPGGGGFSLPQRTGSENVAFQRTQRPVQLWGFSSMLRPDSTSARSFERGKMGAYWG